MTKTLHWVVRDGPVYWVEGDQYPWASFRQQATKFPTKAAAARAVRKAGGMRTCPVRIIAKRRRRDYPFTIGGVTVMVRASSRKRAAVRGRSSADRSHLTGAGAMNSVLNDCFEATEYPDPTTFDLSKPGWRFDYISSTFLDGWINYVRPVRAFVHSRYAEDFGAVKTKLAAWEASPPYHTKLGELGDDVILLGEDKSGRYWLFHYDCDVSDCSIGVLNTEWAGLAGSDVVAAFEAYVRECAEDCKTGYGGTGEALEIPITCIRGWVSW